MRKGLRLNLKLIAYWTILLQNLLGLMVHHSTLVSLLDIFLRSMDLVTLGLNLKCIAYFLNFVQP